MGSTCKAGASFGCSSHPPGDLERERRAAAAVVRRLDREFRRFFAVEPYLWEQEP